MAKLKIDVNDLHKHYGKNEVLKGITTKFYEGDVVCIIGPSGSGKSTFLRSLNLLEEVTSGHITVNGYDLTEKQPMLTTSVKISEWCSNTSTSSHICLFWTTLLLLLLSTS